MQSEIGDEAKEDRKAVVVRSSEVEAGRRTAVVASATTSGEEVDGGAKEENGEHRVEGNGGAKVEIDGEMEEGRTIEVESAEGMIGETTAGAIAETMIAIEGAEMTIDVEMVAAETAEAAVGEATRVGGEEVLQAAAGTLQLRWRCRACSAKQ